MNDRFYEYLLLQGRPLDRNWIRLIGILAPCFMLFYALKVAVTGRARFSSGRRWSFSYSEMELLGFDALLYAVCWLAAAVAVHCFCFWEESVHPYAKFVPPVLVGALGTLAAAVVWLVVRQFERFV